MSDDFHRLDSLEAVVRTAHDLHAHLVLLVGDVFDHNRVSAGLVEAAAEVLARARLPIVILPGNHDCLSEASVYHRGIERPANVHVIGVSVEDTARFPELGLEVWGRAHLDYFDMTPLRDPPRRSLRWQIAAAHGHWVSGPADLHRAYLIHPEELRALDADYVALGHWDVHTRVGDGAVPAYYSGSPTLAKSVNLVRFDERDGVTVHREHVRTH